MNSERMMDMGYMQDGSGFWITPEGEVMSVLQARQDAEQRETKLLAIIADCTDGGPVNGHGE